MKGLYVVASEAATGKSAVALGVHALLSRRVGRLGVFRPVVAGGGAGPDRVLELLRSRMGPGEQAGRYADCVGCTYDDVHEDPDAAVVRIVHRFRALAARCDAVLVVGTDFTDVGAASEFAFNARVAVNVGVPVLGVVSGVGRSAEEVAAGVDMSAAALRGEGCRIAGMIANRVAAGEVDAARELTGASAWVVPEEPVLTEPTIADLFGACAAAVIGGDGSALGHEVARIVVGAMRVENLLGRLAPDAVVITPGDRADVLLAALAAHASRTLPTLSGLLLTGGLRPDEEVLALLAGVETTLPIALTSLDTYEAARVAGTVGGRLRPGATRKLDTALRLFERHVDGEELLRRLEMPGPVVVTPLMFEYELLDRARADRRHIVLPEGDDDRVLCAADSLLRRDVVDLTILGVEADVRKRASQLRLALDGARVVDPADPGLRERYAVEYARIRAHKNVALDAARDRVASVSYVGTMMVALGECDGMVSGARHTTAETIRPAFELLRAGAGIVSSVFLMCLADRVLVYGDCAVNPDPTAPQLADIAIASARTAEQFGIEPRVAMLSYSTGTSGSGADVDKVREATGMVRELAPSLSVDGPIQYDAAVDASVARAKLPGSEVAGRATVFVFPDLNTGNNTYKAVQRSAGAVAIGPVLQGLARPVNDLSRGALVGDIVNTVAITAIQAQTAGRVSISRRPETSH